MAGGRDRVWLLVNILGMGLFFFLAMSGWTAPELKTEVAGFSSEEIVSWGLKALPIPVVFALADLAWLILALGSAFKEGAWFSVLVVFAVAAAWYGLIMVDFAHR